MGQPVEPRHRLVAEPPVGRMREDAKDDLVLRQADVDGFGELDAPVRLVAGIRDPPQQAVLGFEAVEPRRERAERRLHQREAAPRRGRREHAAQGAQPAAVPAQHHELRGRRARRRRMTGHGPDPVHRRALVEHVDGHARQRAIGVTERRSLRLVAPGDAPVGIDHVDEIEGWRRQIDLRRRVARTGQHRRIGQGHGDALGFGRVGLNSGAWPRRAASRSAAAALPRRYCRCPAASSPARPARGP